MRNSFFAFCIFPALLFAQEEAPVKEQISLEGILELCKKSGSPEELEKSLNTSSTAIHNLDLNSDGNIDYLNVDEVSEDNLHLLFVRSEISENAFQDIAVIEIEKAGENMAYVRAVADSLLFGEELAIEPKDEKVLNSEGKGGPCMPVMATRLVRLNCWGWPIVRTLYRPGYSPWVSPWRMKRMPPWYAPWRPLAPAVFKPRLMPPMAYYKPFPYRRAALAHKLYKMHRRQVKMARMQHRMNKGAKRQGPRGRGARGRH